MHAQRRDSMSICCSGVNTLISCESSFCLRILNRFDCLLMLCLCALLLLDKKGIWSIIVIIVIIITITVWMHLYVLDFYSSASVTRGVMFLGCLCVCASGTFDIFSLTFQHRCILGHGWMLQVLDSKGQSSRSQCYPTCWKRHIWPWNDSTEFHETFSMMHFGTRLNTSIFEVKMSKVKVTDWRRPNWQRHTKLDAAHWVLISSFFYLLTPFAYTVFNVCYYISFFLSFCGFVCWYLCTNEDIYYYCYYIW